MAKQLNSTAEASKAVAKKDYLGPGEKMRFSSLTYEIIEELKMRRELDGENEKKIQKLLEDRFSLGWKLDQEYKQISSVAEKHEAELRDVRRQLHEKMKDFQVEASQHQVYRKLAEKEREAMKEEIRKLQFVNYSLEKKVRESDHQDKLQATEREHHINQVSKYEAMYSQVENLSSQLEGRLNKLDGDLQAVQELNQRLQYENKHQNCMLRMKEEDIVSLRQELLEVNVKGKLDPAELKEKEQAHQEEVDRLQSTITELEASKCRLEREGEDWKQKYWDSLKKLDEAHKLVNIHLHNSAAYRDECKAAEGERDDTRAELEQSRSNVEDLEKHVVDLERKLAEEREEWKQQEENLKVDLSSLGENLETLRQEKETIIESLKKAADNLATVEQELEEAKATLNKEKQCQEVQTQLCMLEVTNASTQVIPDEADKSIQATMDTLVNSTQTIDPALKSSSVQTENDPMMVEEAPRLELNDFGIQAVRDTNEREVQTDEMEMPNCDDTDSKSEAFSNKEIVSNIPIESADFTVEKIVPDANVQETTSINVSTNIDDMRHFDRAGKKREEQSNDTGLGKSDVNENTQEEKPFEDISEENDVVIDAKYTESSHTVGPQYNENMVFTKGISEMSNLVHESVDTNTDFKNTGLSVPAIDIRTVTENETVIIEPDDFEVKLTQDEHCNTAVDRTGTYDVEMSEVADEIQCEVFGGVRNSNRISFVELSSESSQDNSQNSTTLKDDDALENALNKNWSSDMQPKKSKQRRSKSGKHKLQSVHNVQEKFVEFEKCKEQFETKVQPSSPQFIASKIPRIETNTCPPIEMLGKLQTSSLPHSSTHSDVEHDGKTTPFEKSATDNPRTTLSTADVPQATGQQDDRVKEGKSGLDFLQKYRDMMAKMKKPSPKTSFPQVLDDHPRQIKIGQSPQYTTPKGILKGPSRHSKKNQNISWSSFVEMKDIP